MLASFLTVLPGLVPGVLGLTGLTLALARRYPVVRLTGLALQLPAWIFWALLESGAGYPVFTVAASLMAGWTLWQVWQMREQIR
jgi:hypothetical protein